jgi:hypothetical protein
MAGVGMAVGSPVGGSVVRGVMLIVFSTVLARVGLIKTSSSRILVENVSTPKESRTCLDDTPRAAEILAMTL